METHDMKLQANVFCADVDTRGGLELLQFGRFDFTYCIENVIISWYDYSKHCDVLTVHAVHTVHASVCYVLQYSWGYILS